MQLAGFQPITAKTWQTYVIRQLRTDMASGSPLNQPGWQLSKRFRPLPDASILGAYNPTVEGGADGSENSLPY